MSAYLVLYEIDRPFATVYPRPFSAPAAASWKESPNNGEKPDSWSECESTSINGNGNGIDRESKRYLKRIFIYSLDAFIGISDNFLFWTSFFTLRESFYAWKTFKIETEKLGVNVLQE